MKNRIKIRLNIGTLFSIILIAVCILLPVSDMPLCRLLLEKSVILSSKTVLVGAKEKSEEKSPDAALTESETQSHTAESERAEETKKENETEDTAAVAVTDDFTCEPEDIAALVKKYEEKSQKDKKDGSITEMTYTKSGVTDSYKNVRVKNVNDTSIDIEKLLERKADIKIEDKTQPTVLIYHTHTTESYQILDRSFYAQGYLTRSDNSGENMIRVGKEICSQLEKAGFCVIHDTTVYDKKYNGAYQRSRVTVEDYLKKYPSIQVTLDIHRDAIQYNDGTKVKPVAEVLGKKCAQMMIISGCQEEGNGIENFEDWEYNLVFALHLQKCLEDMYSGIMRPLYFCPRRYNMNVNHCSLLIEMGSDANTLGEGVYAGRCLGTALASLLEEYIS